MPAFVELINPDTGAFVRVPDAVLSEGAAPRAELRRRLRAADPQSAWAGAAADAVRVDAARRTYAFARYPPLSFFIDTRLVVVAGAFLLAACAQVYFYFPCLGGFTLVMPAGAPAATATNPGFCVDNSVLGALPAAPSAAALAATAGATARIAVTMQTYGVMMLGAIAGRAGGAAAAALYVAMVCVGAPFGAASGGVGTAVWNKGGVLGASGGFFWGFIAAALVMGRAMERGAGRGSSWRSALWLVPHMVGAEALIYAAGLAWYPFARAYRAGVAVAATPVLGCSAAAGPNPGAGACLYTVANALLVPYLPGEAFKMALVLVTVPAAWALLLRVHAWRAGAAGAALAAADFSPPSALDEAAADADERGGDAAAVNVGAGGAAAAGADVDGARDAAAQNDAAALPGSALLAVRAARLA